MSRWDEKSTWDMSKLWYQSKAVWGGVAAAGGAAVTAYKAFATGNMDVAMTSAGVAVAAAYAVYGRIVAKGPIG